MMRNPTIDAQRALSQVTMKVYVKGLRRLKFRLWMADKLFRFAAWAIGVSRVDIITEEQAHE